MRNMPIVHKFDDGIRPAGKPDECFYCKQKVGQPHKPDCVCVEKTVRLKYTFEVEVQVPHGWTPESINFHRNESSWCADNALSELEAYAHKNGCLCGVFHSEFIEVVDDTPTRKIREVRHGS